jgi:hypothetical protein
MIVDNLNIECVAVSKTKAHAPLIVDPDCMAAGPITPQRFKTIGRRQPQVLDPCCGVSLAQPHGSTTQDVARHPPCFACFEKALGFGIGKRTDHWSMI